MSAGNAADSLDVRDKESYTFAMNTGIKPVTKIFLAAPGGHGKPFLGPGMIQLLEKIKTNYNVRSACEEMQMSYSKGWKLLRTLESCLQFQVVARKQGGQGGGDTRLTPQGERFLAHHQKFEQACLNSVEKLFKRYYSDTASSC